MFESGARPASARVGFIVTIAVLGSLALAGGYGDLSPVGSAAAATGVTVSFDPVEATVGPNGSTTHDVVVSSTVGGVGSYDITVTSTSPSVVGITGASSAIGGESNIDVERDRSKARIGAFAGNTVDEGSNVTIARVTVAGDGQVGRSTLLVDIHSLSDEYGTQYGIDSTRTGTVRVQTAQFRTTSLRVGPNPAALGDQVEFTVGIENTGPVAGDTTVTGIFDGTIVSQRTLRMPAGGANETTFEVTPSSPGTYSVGVTGLDISRAESSVTVRRIPSLTDSGAPATDPDGDGLYEDVNGDGEVTPGDATVLFDAVFERNPAVMDKPVLFDFSGDGELTPGDVTVLFAESL
jgi:hypothetical protein